MAAIASINASQTGSFAAALTTLSASDTITIAPGKKQLLVIRNPTGGSLTLKIDGDGGSTVNAAQLGLGSVTVSAGYDIVVGAGLSVAVVLGTISAYCQGVVTLTGAATCVVQLFDL
jgi:hypothetical protein